MGIGRVLGLAALAATAGLGVLAACGGDDVVPSPATTEDGGTTTTPAADATTLVDAALPTPIEACQAYIQAYCDRVQECGRPASRCAELEALCPEYSFADGSARTVESVVACTRVRRQQPCSDVLAGLTPDCSPPGVLDAGAPCRFVAQCASFGCSSTQGLCGTCAAPSTDGTCTERCTDSRCVACDVNSQCIGGSCSPRTPFADAGLVCTFGDGGARPCDAPATTLLKALGEPCTAKSDCATAAECNADHVCALSACQ